MSVKLQCQATGRLARVIALARIEFGTKDKVLKARMNLALTDRVRFASDRSQTDGTMEGCSLTLENADFEATREYRETYLLVTKTSFFLHALEHGATRFLQQNPRLSGLSV